MAMVATAQELRFHRDGTFKIVQFTDLHLHGGKLDKSERAYQVVDTIMRCERPDLVVITGDLIYGTPARPVYQRLLRRMAAYGVPFVVMPGNHDHEQDIPMTEFCAMACETSSCLNVPDENGLLADIVLPVKGCRTDRTRALLYCMDSHAYSPRKDIKGYAWFTPEQIQWYCETSKAYNSHRKLFQRPIMAMAFYHIPVPEYALASASGVLCGSRGEPESCPAYNSGMFQAMQECGGMVAHFVGHDHDNDYVARYEGVNLIYGRYSGANTVYNHLVPGARIINLREGKHSFETYVRLIDGSVLQTYESGHHKK